MYEDILVNDFEIYLKNAVYRILFKSYEFIFEVSFELDYEISNPVDLNIDRILFQSDNFSEKSFEKRFGRLLLNDLSIVLDSHLLRNYE